METLNEQWVIVRGRKHLVYFQGIDFEITYEDHMYLPGICTSKRIEEGAKFHDYTDALLTLNLVNQLSEIKFKLLNKSKWENHS